MGNRSSRFLPLVITLGVTCLVGFPAPLLPRLALPKQTAVPIAGSNPSVCIAYNEANNTWGEEFGFCPKGYAAYAVADAGGKERKGEKIPAVQTCCPLPAPDILTDEQVLVTESCPEDWVATGSRLDFSKGDDSTQLMRCTKINSQRYQLGAPSPSLYWGNGFAGWQGSRRIDVDRVPAGLRYALGRQSKDHWSGEGCIGLPFGSLLTSKSAKYCGGFNFRELQFRGLAGDPPEGTPVQMFAECSEVSGLDDPSHTVCRQG